jgi:hypothetical protein
MLEKIDGWDLLPGEFYFIKSPIANVRIRKARMVRYMNIKYEEVTGLFDAPTFGMCIIELHLWTFYRYVSREEYKEKVREKYNATCLDIVLKRLVNETFTW